MAHNAPDRRQRERRRMETDLAAAGWGLLLGSAILLAVVVLFATGYGGEMLLGATVGGALGLAFALRFPGNPSRAGYVFVKLPKQLSPYEQELRGEIMGRRSLRLTVLLVAPYLLALAGLGVWGMYTGPSIDLGSQVLSAFISAVQATSLSWAIQYLQVLRALRHADRDGASE